MVNKETGMRYTRSANGTEVYINNVNSACTFRQCDDLQIDYKVTPGSEMHA